ncbi:hypothetical protein TELCIR_07535 [Teladorsagia circumcincta]|uniref:Tc1-like transposase DDE domain-containing protein n=1 Tax=Teladorsagia circumcincta TaxID=45464 RepID=A0A2G9UKD4_TELCI|nr:hypothetical protein TELCIR_07535 [Teladorsagia circumcincta]
MLSIWRDLHGPVLWQLLDKIATVTANLYTQQLRDLKRIVDQRHDNARPHVAREVKSELLQYGWTVLPHHSYSPNIANSDYRLFYDLTRYLEGKCFKTRAQVETELTSYFASRQPAFRRDGKPLERWQEVVDNDGGYI